MSKSILKEILFFLLCFLLSSDVFSKEGTIDLNLVRTKKSNTIIGSTKNNRRILSDREINIQYVENEGYFNTVLGIGSPEQYFSVQIDTTTSVTWVPSTQSEEYNSTTKYNSTASHTSKVKNKTVTIFDEDGNVQGYETFDVLNLEGLIADDFGFVQVTKYDDEFDDYKNGKLGLGYRNPFGHKFSILDTLKKSGAINKKIFSLSETNSTHGKLQIGDYPNQYKIDNSNYSSCNTTLTDELDEEYKDSWVCELSHILFGKAENFSDTLEIKHAFIIFDSAYEYISVPIEYLNFFKTFYLEKTENNLNCSEILVNDETCFICSKLENFTNFNNMDSINFFLEGFAYSVAAEDLFESVNGTHYEFLIKFTKENDNIWSLGNPFMSQYLVIFNAEENHVGFLGGERVDFQDDWGNWLHNSTQDQKKTELYYLMIGAAVLGALLFILLIFIIVHSLRRRRLEEHGPLINEKNRH